MDGNRSIQELAIYIQYTRSAKMSQIKFDLLTHSVTNSQHGRPGIFYICSASPMVSGNFFPNVSGLKKTAIAAMIADAPNKRAGNEPKCEPWQKSRI